MNCNECRYAIWDCEEFIGGGKQYYIEGCKLGYQDKEECEKERRFVYIMVGGCNTVTVATLSSI